MLRELADRLYRTGGKKQYGYLKSDVKAIVNRIVVELSADERIAALYDLWYEQREKVLGIYTKTFPNEYLSWTTRNSSPEECGDTRSHEHPCRYHSHRRR